MDINQQWAKSQEEYEIARLRAQIAGQQARIAELDSALDACLNGKRVPIAVANRTDDLSALAAYDTEKNEQINAAYTERNRLVALLAKLFPSGKARTAIPGWDEAWHGCVYIDFPWGQASWHYHDSDAALFDDLTPYQGSWDGHTTTEKYEAIALANLSGHDAEVRRKVFQDILDDDTLWIDLEEFMAWVRRMAKEEKSDGVRTL